MLLAIREEENASRPDDFRQLLDAQTTQIAESLQNQIEKRFEILESQIENVNDTITGVFKFQIEQMFEDLTSKITQLYQGNGQQKSELELPTVVSKSNDTASHWHKQKEAMLSKYGIDPDYRPVMDLPRKPVPETPPSEPAPVEPASVESVSVIPEADAAAIEELKERLNAKLRETEIELSIGRAKISQQRALLDEEQVEFDRRAKLIEEKYQALMSAPSRRVGFFKWLWQHLKPKPPQANDRA